MGKIIFFSFWCSSIWGLFSRQNEWRLFINSEETYFKKPAFFLLPLSPLFSSLPFFLPFSLLTLISLRKTIAQSCLKALCTLFLWDLGKIGRLPFHSPGCTWPGIEPYLLSASALVGRFFTCTTWEMYLWAKCNWLILSTW